MRKRLIVLFTIVCLISCGAERGERVNTVDTSGMVTMYTTAYNLHGITANGGTTRPNIAACNGHLGEIAILYTMEGEYLTTVEITDTGGSEGMKAGKVVKGGRFGRQVQSSIYQRTGLKGEKRDE